MTERARTNAGAGGAAAAGIDGIGMAREETMRHVLNCLSWTAALAAALLTAVIGSWHEISMPALTVRCLVAGLLVLVFLRGGGELAYRAMLRSLAEHQIRQDEERRERRNRQRKEKLARQADEMDSAMETPGVGQGQEARFTNDERTSEADSNESTSMDRKAA